MRRACFGIVFALAGTTACGEGRAIFNVDIYSFLLADQADTIQYVVPPAVSLSPQDTIPVSLLGGLQNSGVDSLRFTGSLNFDNTSGGPGTITYEVFFDDSVATLFSGSPTISIPPTTVGPGAVTTTAQIAVDVTGAIRDLFVQPSIFVGVRATVSNSGATLLEGRIRVTALDMRLIVNDQVF